MAKRLTQGKVLTALHGGARIMKTIINEPPSKAGVFYALTTGQPVRKDLLERLLSDGLIQECADGLDILAKTEQAGTFQTYELARSEA